MYLDPLVKYSNQKQNLLVCRSWYNAFLRLYRYIRNPEFIDWINANHEVVFVGKYKDAKYRINNLLQRKVKVNIETKDIDLPNIFHNITILMRENTKMCKNIDANKLTVFARKGGRKLEIHNCKLNVNSIGIHYEYQEINMSNTVIRSSHLSITAGVLRMVDVEIYATYLRLDVMRYIRMTNCTINADTIYFGECVPENIETGELGTNTKIYAKVVYMLEDNYMQDEIEKSVIGLETLELIMPRSEKTC